jgi:hypothetical protein
MVQALAFAEMLAGGLFLTSAILKIPLGELFKHGLHGLSTAGSTGTASSGTGSSSGGSPAGPGESGAGRHAPATPAEQKAQGGQTAPPPGEAFFLEEKKKLESYLKRPLTPKEIKELHTYASKP